MFSLFRREYLAIRRVADYVRFYEGDSDAVFPSIFLRGKGRSKGEKRDEPSEPEDPRDEEIRRNPAPAPAPSPRSNDDLPQEDPFRVR
jgi:hypothetical protein